MGVTMFIGYYNYAVMLTYLSMLISFGGISYAVDGNIFAACICLLISGICDTFDGKIARTKKRTHHEKRFGIQLDSLSDVVCFGVLPATITYRLGGPHNHLTLAVCALYVLAAIIRLSWFNVDEEVRQDQTSTDRKYYTGLPVTVSAFVYPVICLITSLYQAIIIATILLAILAIAFVAPIKVPKLNFSLHRQKEKDEKHA